MRIRPVPALLGVVGMGLGLLAVLVLREATLSTHDNVDPGSRVEMVLEARSKGGERGQSLPEMVEALLAACRLEVPADVAPAIRDEGDGRFRAVLRPALDHTDRRQLRGCVEDWSIDHLRVDVVAFETSP